MFVQGFIRICCCQSCVVEYHMTCWKTLKTSSFFEKNEKVHLDFKAVLLKFQVILSCFPVLPLLFMICVAGFLAGTMFDTGLCGKNL